MDTKSSIIKAKENKIKASHASEITNVIKNNRSDHVNHRMPMEFCLDRCRNVDKETKYGVFGFIRNEQKLISQSNNACFPESVFWICLSYIYNPEFFTTIKLEYESCTSLDEDSTKVTMDTNNLTTFGSQATVFGNVTIDKYSSGIYEWTFKIDGQVPPNNISIGISSIDKGSFYGLQSNGFCRIHNDDSRALSIESYGFTFSDPIKMKYDTSNKSLQYYTNNTRIALINDIDIQVDDTFRMAARLDTYLYGQVISLQLIHFDHYHLK